MGYIVTIDRSSTELYIENATSTEDAEAQAMEVFKKGRSLYDDASEFWVGDITRSGDVLFENSRSVDLRTWLDESAKE